MKSDIYRAGVGKSERLENSLPQEGGGSFKQFFRVSKLVQTPQMLDSWIEWFRLHNIPCAVTKGSGGYSLWRGGEEVGGGASIELSALKKKKIVSSFGILPVDEEDA